MTKPTIKEVNAATGEEVIRDMNEAEILQLEKDRAEIKAQIEAYEQRIAAKAILLERLGITEDEAKLLLG